MDTLIWFALCVIVLSKSNEMKWNEIFIIFEGAQMQKIITPLKCVKPKVMSLFWKWKE